MHQAGKLQNIKEEAIRLKVDILGLAEVRWLGSGKLVSEDHTLIYSGHKREHKHGVGILLSNVVARSVIGFHVISDKIIIVKLCSKPFNLSIIQVYAPTSASSEEELEAFYNDLDVAYKQCGSQEMVVVMGDLNAKVGTEQDPQKVVIRLHGLGERNERGDLCVDGSKRHGLQAVEMSQRTRAAVQIVSNLPDLSFCACRPCGPAGWLALLLTKAGDVETNPGPTTLNKQVWICDICINKYTSESRTP